MNRNTEVRKLISHLSAQDIFYLGTNKLYLYYDKMWTKQDNYKIIGYLALYERGVNSAYLVGAIDPQYRRQGIASDLIERALDYFYHREDLDNLMYIIYTGNENSLKLASKFNFKYKFNLSANISVYMVTK